MRTIFLFLIFFLLLAACQDANKARSFEQMATRIVNAYTDDRRTDRTEIEHRNGFRGLYVDGYTTVPAAYDSLRAALATGFTVAENNFRLLPDTARLEGRTAGIVNVSVANLRSKPGHSQELATQALMGTPLEVLDVNDDGWYLVRTPDRYLAWLEGGAFVGMTPRQAAAWLKAAKYRLTAPAELLPEPGAGDPLSDLTPGALVATGGTSEGVYAFVRTPAGETGYVPAAGLTPASDDFLAPDSLPAPDLLATARRLAGRPYLWGGTSPKAMDCSGFTKTAYYLNGFVIPRDASQQVHAGQAVEITDDLANLQPADLLFFGRFRDDGSEKITHVGFYLGQGRFLHAGADNGRIRTESLIEGQPDYAAHRRASLLRARRLRPGTEGVVPVGEAFRGLVR